MQNFTKKIRPFTYITALYLTISLILRVVFMFHPITTSDFSIFEVLKIIFIGALADSFTIILASSLMAIYLLFISNNKYHKPYGYIIFGVLVILMLYTKFVPNNIFAQYGGSVQEIALTFLGIKTLCFGIMLFLQKQRRNIRNILYFSTIFIYSLSIIFNSVSEYFFWNEFGIRYNFIAVDYLIYTNEVIGNIIESYPVIPLFSIILSVTILVSIFIFIKTKSAIEEIPTIREKGILLAIYLFLSGISLAIIPQFDKIKSSNIFSQEIQANGLYKFYYAFTHSELDFFQFYPTIAQKEAEKTILQQFNSTELERKIVGRGEEIHKNVVLISIESLSAEFMKFYGNQENITPFLDSLAQKSIFFTNFYATGNRTVRGLEALTLCLPPTAGESIVKRTDNKNKFSTGSVFKEKGYQVKYLYGGYSYFDNMKDFFGGNGYDIVDRDSFSPEEITFSNVWGVCDEDMAKKAIQTMNSEYKKGKPFFNHWMTVSNHRPFTYPNNKIDIPSDAKSRSGGVKYTDYSLKQFFKMAEKEEWFKNTIFVIVADHCASSAGKTELPMDKYRIPAMIYTPDIHPQKIDKLVSQIDLMPTVLGLLNFNYQSKFLGEDVFSPHYQERAYIATYQDLGYIRNNTLTTISPMRKVKQYLLETSAEQPSKDNPIFFNEKPKKDIDKNLEKETISAYQSASYWIQKKMLNR